MRKNLQKKKERARYSSYTPQRNWSQSNIDIIQGELPGQIIRGKYEVGRLLDRGSCGEVHKVLDLNDHEVQLAMKVSQKSAQFSKEISMMRKIWKKS